MARWLWAARPWPESLAVFLIACVARLWGIADKPYWMDELTTIRRASKPFGALIADALTFHHLPGYFLLTSWMLPFGTGEAVLRLPSAIPGALACATLCAIGSAIGGGRAGLLAGLLMALSPLQVQYGQEARSYALVTCAILIALRGLVGLAQDPRRASIPLTARGRHAALSLWALYAGGTWAALNILSVALFWVLAANVAAVAIAWHPAADRGRFARNWGLAHAAIAILTLPWFAAMLLFAHGEVASGLDWVPPLNAERIWSTLSSVYFMRVSSLINFHLFEAPIRCFGLLVAALAALGAVWIWRRRPMRVVLAAALLVLPVSLLAISLMHPVWMPRYVLWSAGPFFLLAGLGLGHLPRTARTPVLAVVTLLAAINLAPYYQAETKPRWDQAAKVIGAERKKGDLVLVDDPQAVRMMNFYLERGGNKLVREEWTTDIDEAALRLAVGGRVWAVQGAIGQADQRTRQAFLDRLTPLGPSTATIEKGRDVVIVRFDGQPPPQDPPADSGTPDP